MPFTAISLSLSCLFAQKPAKYTLYLGFLVVFFVLAGCQEIKEQETSKQQYDHYYGKPKHANAHHKAIPTIELQSNAPKRYVVKKGDTLWGIAKKFIKQPWYWPEIWDKNQKIKNPHLIYPGDVLTLYFKKREGHASQDDGKLVPTIRVERGLIGEPVAIITPFLAWPRILDKTTISQAPYIVASRDERHLIPNGDLIYVKQLQNAKVGKRYAIYHDKKPLVDPDTGQLLGNEVVYKGYSRIERLEPLATAKVLSVMQEIRAGDRLLEVEDHRRYLHAEMQPPNHKVRGTVIGLYDANAISGQYMIAAVNRGSQHQLAVGHVVGLYADGKVVRDRYESEKRDAYRAQQSFNANPPSYQPTFDSRVELPPEPIGQMVIYAVTPKVSYGLIVESERALRLGDKMGNLP